MSLPPATLPRRQRRLAQRAARQDTPSRRQSRRPGLGLLSLLAYWLVLNAYAIAPVSYAGAMREMSVVFGALTGWIFLKEGFGAVRAFGSVIIFAGILIVAIAG